MIDAMTALPALARELQQILDRTFPQIEAARRSGAAWEGALLTIMVLNFGPIGPARPPCSNGPEANS